MLAAAHQLYQFSPCVIKLPLVPEKRGEVSCDRVDPGLSLNFVAFARHEVVVFFKRLDVQMGKSRGDAIDEHLFTI